MPVLNQMKEFTELNLRGHSCLLFRQLSSRQRPSVETRLQMISELGGLESPRYGRQEYLRYREE